MNTPKIPRGWRKLHPNTILREGDKFYFVGTRRWHFTSRAGHRAGGGALIARDYIRRIKP